MALIKCKECGNEVSTKAESCPKCGAKTPKKTGLLTWLVVLGIGYWIFFSSSRAYNDYVTQSEAAEAGAAEQAASLEPEPPKSPWHYWTKKDDLEGYESRFGIINSENLVQFDFPHQGGSRGTLMLRDSPKYGFDIIFSVDKGHILCSHRDCSVTIKSGDDPSFEMGASEPTDHSSNTLFLDNPKKVLALLRSGKPLKIQAQFYQAGYNTYAFEPAGLEWKSESK